MHSDGTVSTLYVGARLSGGNSTWWGKWDVPQSVGVFVATFDD